MRNLYLILSTLLLTVTTLSAQPRGSYRIPELESNAEYVTLLRDEAQLKMQTDSVAAELIRMRQQLRDDPGNRFRYQQQIMRTESRQMELNEEISRLRSRIDDIELEWVLSNQNSSALQRMQTRSSSGQLPDSLQRPNLIYNLPFEEYLARQDYVKLRRAQEREQEALTFVNRYISNYFTLRDMAASYQEAENESTAIELYARIGELADQNRLLADSLEVCWTLIDEEKNYAYDFILESLQQEPLLDEQTQRKNSALREIRRLEGRTTSDALASYILSKRALVAYESVVANVLGLRPAIDSLKEVESQIAAVCDQFCALPEITVRERFFIQYDTLKFASRSQYSDKNPIPECKVYQRGTIFRVLLATYSVNKPTYATFRNTAPIYKLRTEDGKTRYFAGGFATEQEAVEAQARLKKHGFRAPEVVVWIDGVYRNLTNEPLPTATLSGFRLEISGVEVLTEQMRAALSVVSTSVEVSRAGSRYIVGTFADRTQAEQAVTALHGVDPTIEVKVIELSIPAAASSEPAK